MKLFSVDNLMAGFLVCICVGLIMAMISYPINSLILMGVILGILAVGHCTIFIYNKFRNF